MKKSLSFLVVITILLSSNFCFALNKSSLSKSGLDELSKASLESKKFFQKAKACFAKGDFECSLKKLHSTVSNMNSRSMNFKNINDDKIYQMGEVDLDSVNKLYAELDIIFSNIGNPSSEEELSLVKSKLINLYETGYEYYKNMIGKSLEYADENNLYNIYSNTNLLVKYANWAKFTPFNENLSFVNSENDNYWLKFLLRKGEDAVVEGTLKRNIDTFEKVARTKEDVFQKLNETRKFLSFVKSTANKNGFGFSDSFQLMWRDLEFYIIEVENKVTASKLPNTISGKG